MRGSTCGGQGADAPFTVGHSDGIDLASSGMESVNPERRSRDGLVDQIGDA
jgi:hypothetical protein